MDARIISVNREHFILLKNVDINSHGEYYAELTDEELIALYEDIKYRVENYVNPRLKREKEMPKRPPIDPGNPPTLLKGIGGFKNE